MISQVFLKVQQKRNFIPGGVLMSRKTEPRHITEQAIFPIRLRNLMEENKVTQKTLAEVIDMRPQTVSLYIGGQSVPDINTLLKIAEFFHVSADWLIGRPNSARSTDLEIQGVCMYTGLSESVVEWAHSLADKPDLLQTLNALMEHETFQSVIPFIRDLSAVQKSSELERWGNGAAEPPAECGSGRYIVDAFEYQYVLEYRISTWLQMIVDDITKPAQEEDHG